MRVDMARSRTRQEGAARQKAAEGVVKAAKEAEARGKDGQAAATKAADAAAAEVE